MESRLQPILGALLGALNACWHLPIQYTVLRSLALLALWQLRTHSHSHFHEEFAAYKGPLAALAPVVAVECHRILLFYSAVSSGVDITAASTAYREQLCQAAREVLKLLLQLNPAAVAAVEAAAVLAAGAAAGGPTE